MITEARLPGASIQCYVYGTSCHEPCWYKNSTFVMVLGSRNVRAGVCRQVYMVQCMIAMKHNLHVCDVQGMAGVQVPVKWVLLEGNPALKKC